MGVSTQRVGVEGGVGLVSVASLPLKMVDPARYGSLQHPGHVRLSSDRIGPSALGRLTRRLAALDPASPAGSLGVGDAAGIALLGITCTGYAVVALSR